MTLPTGAPRMPGLGRLWWGLAAAPVAWALAELVGYPVAARRCEPASRGLRAQSLADPRVWTLGLTALFTMLAISGLWIAISSVRTTMHARGAEAPTPQPHPMTGDTATWGRAHFMAVAGVFVSSIFVGGTVLYGLPSLIVNVCAQVR
jgi:hypothetical protein